MKTPLELQNLKCIPIADYLAYRGFQPVHKSGKQLVYHSPIRDDKTASFWVNQELNRYKDFGLAGKGDDLFSLVMLMERCSFAEAIQKLEAYANTSPSPLTFSFSGQKHKPSSEWLADEVKAVKLLNSKPLIRYAESRKIPYPIARKYCREVYYTNRGRRFFHLGFENDLGGFELRGEYRDNKQVKRCIGSKAITTIPFDWTRTVNVFEGFFDFLSALAYYRQNTPTHTTIILNSTTQINEALPILSKYEQINAYFDRDQTGLETLNILRANKLRVIDYSGIYDGYKDFNQYWCSR